MVLPSPRGRGKKKYVHGGLVLDSNLIECVLRNIVCVQLSNFVRLPFSSVLSISGEAKDGSAPVEGKCLKRQGS